MLLKSMNELINNLIYFELNRKVLPRHWYPFFYIICHILFQDKNMVAERGGEKERERERERDEQILHNIMLE